MSPWIHRPSLNVGGLTAKAAHELGLVEGIPVFGGYDDTQSAAIGSGAALDGEAHIYLGTSAWVAVTTRKVQKFRNAAVCLQSGDPNIHDIYGLMDEHVSKVPPGSDYLICTPWMQGERCPISSTTTRATLFSISSGHTREHLMRAVYEGVVYNLRRILENYRRDFRFDIPSVKIVGGGALDKQWMQIIADASRRRVETVEQPKMAGAMGAAMCAAVGLGI